MPRVHDVTGQRFGRLKVLRRAKSGASGVYWDCKCDCGEYAVVRSNHLRAGLIQSCGCLRREVTAARARTHGYTLGGKKSRLYRIWVSMKTRCNNARHGNYERYGARGIAICPEWQTSFEIFRDWAVANGYEPHLTIDRINNDGNYESSNCRWATYLQQRHNRRDCINEGSSYEKESIL